MYPPKLWLNLGGELIPGWFLGAKPVPRSPPNRDQPNEVPRSLTLRLVFQADEPIADYAAMDDVMQGEGNPGLRSGESLGPIALDLGCKSRKWRQTRDIGGLLSLSTGIQPLR